MCGGSRTDSYMQKDIEVAMADTARAHAIRILRAAPAHLRIIQSLKPNNDIKKDSF